MDLSNCTFFAKFFQFCNTNPRRRHHIISLCIRHPICHSVHTSNVFEKNPFFRKFDLIFVKAMIYPWVVRLNWKILQSHIIKILLIVVLYVFHGVVRITSAKSSYFEGVIHTQYFPDTV